MTSAPTPTRVEPVKSAAPATFANAAEHVASVLGTPIDERHLKQLKKPTKNGDITLDFFPWAVLCKCLHHRAPGWSWELREVTVMGSYVVVTGRLSIPSGNTTLTYDAVSSEPMETKGAPPIETAASSCLRRACALAGLGLDLWLDP